MHGICYLFQIPRRGFRNFSSHSGPRDHLLWHSVLMAPGKHLKNVPLLKHLYPSSIHSWAARAAKALVYDVQMWHLCPPPQSPLTLIKADGEFSFSSELFSKSLITLSGPHLLCSLPLSHQCFGFGDHQDALVNVCGPPLKSC